MVIFTMLVLFINQLALLNEEHYNPHAGTLHLPIEQEVLTTQLAISISIIRFAHRLVHSIEFHGSLVHHLVDW